MEEAKIDFKFEWQNILEEENKKYLFPNQITDFMKRKYRCPAVYRWIIKNKEEIVHIYIGEAEELCPRRINHYLNPGPSQQTNLRLNKKFKELIEKGCEVGLDILKFNFLNFNGFKVIHQDLIEKSNRVFIESMMICYYKNKDCSLLNLTRSKDK